MSAPGRFCCKSRHTDGAGRLMPFVEAVRCHPLDCAGRLTLDFTDACNGYAEHAGAEWWWPGYGGPLSACGRPLAIRRRIAASRAARMTIAAKWSPCRDEHRMTSAIGTFRTWRLRLVMSVHRCQAEIICSLRVFRLLTPNGNCKIPE